MSATGSRHICGQYWNNKNLQFPSSNLKLWKKKWTRGNTYKIISWIKPIKLELSWLFNGMILNISVDLAVGGHEKWILIILIIGPRVLFKRRPQLSESEQFFATNATEEEQFIYPLTARHQQTFKYKRLKEDSKWCSSTDLVQYDHDQMLSSAV